MSAVENPPAFPFGQNWEMPDGEPMWKNHDGMSLRDWLAGQALAGLCANPQAVSGSTWAQTGHKMLATAAYNVADAMLATRSTGEAQS